jgi:hypothetical protein
MGAAQPVPQQHQPRDHQHTSYHTPADCAVGHHFLSQHKQGQGRHPEQMHHASDKEEGHEHPTTARAVQALSEAHGEGILAAFAPLGHQAS